MCRGRDGADWGVFWVSEMEKPPPSDRGPPRAVHDHRPGVWLPSLGRPCLDAGRAMPLPHRPHRPCDTTAFFVTAKPDHSVFLKQALAGHA